MTDYWNKPIKKYRKYNKGDFSKTNVILSSSLKNSVLSTASYDSKTIVLRDSFQM